MLLVLRRFLTVLALGLATPAWAALHLVMVERDGCVYCAAWDAAIAPIYPKTPEGQAAPLQRVNIRDMETSGLAFARPVVFTPTFVLMEEGREIDRIEGYPGEDFFWGLLGQMLAKTENDKGEDTK
jgi:thioredoxin-related protein